MKRYLHIVFALIVTSIGIHCSAQEIITTVVGTGAEGFHGDSVSALDCDLHWPESVAIDANSNIYIADALNNVVREVNAETGIITTIAGTGAEAGTGAGGFSGDGGPATAADLSYPSGVAVDASGNVYIADQKNNRIREVTVSDGNINTIAGTGAIGYMGDGAAATLESLSYPTRVTLDASGNIYIADSGNGRIREVVSGIINTIAGNGTRGSAGDGGVATKAQLFDPIDMAVDASGNVYIADFVNNKIRIVYASTGNIATFAGTGIPGFSGDSAAATNAYMYEPSGIAIDASGNVYVSDLANKRIRVINTGDSIFTIAGDGTDGYNGDGIPAIQAELWFPEGLALDNRGQLYIADKGNNRIRLLSEVLGVNQVSHAPASVNIFPNPNTGNFTFHFTSGFNEDVAVSIVDVTGQVIEKLNTATNKDVPIVLDVSPGIYFLSAATAHGFINERVEVK